MNSNTSYVIINLILTVVSNLYRFNSNTSYVIINLYYFHCHFVKITYSNTSYVIINRTKISILIL